MRIPTILKDYNSARMMRPSKCKEEQEKKLKIN
jgi:hypothetical protein